MCTRVHGGMRAGIHYNAVSNIMIQAHARWVVTAVGRSRRDGGNGKVTSLQNQRGDERLGDAGGEAIWGSNSSACSGRFIQSVTSAFARL